MAQLQTVQGCRSLFVLRNLQNRIGKLLPNSKDFCEYRNEILNDENITDSKALIDNEERLRQEKDRLEKLIEEVKDDEKKKEFVVTRSKLNTTRTNLRDISKRLNRLLYETKTVVENEMKLQSIFLWLKEKLGSDDIQNFLEGQHDGSNVSRTTIEKNQAMMTIYISLQSDISKLKNRHTAISLKRIELESISKEIEQSERNLKSYQKCSDGGLNSHNSEKSQMKESKVREFREVEDEIKEEINKTKNDIEIEKEKHLHTMNHCSQKISTTQTSLDYLQNKWNCLSKDLRKILRESVEERESNLKILLDLRLSWQQYKNKKETVVQEKILMKALHDEKEKQHQAAIILQNKVRVTYLSKLKKNTRKIGKKKKNSKGKKKKK